jgi:1-acyl-sn-glycerol-3-phosphate acyltransferase
MSRTEGGYPMYRLTTWFLRVGLKLWNRLEVFGSANVPRAGGCIIAANHASFLDPPIVGVGAFHRVVRFLARDTLYKGPTGKSFFLSIATIPISRDRGDVAAMRKAIQELRKGSCIGLFPEGTRSRNGELQQPKTGIGFLIARSAVPVVPAYVEGSFRAFPRGTGFIKPAKVRIYFGPAIQPEEMAKWTGDRSGYEEIGRLVMSRIAALRPHE